MNREIYNLKVFSTRMEYGPFRFELTPEENAEENEFFGMQFQVTVHCRGELCAKLWGKLFDENLVYASAMDILNVADPFGPEEVALAEAFNDCPELCVKTDEWDGARGFSSDGARGFSSDVVRGFSGYLQGVFVQPAFRRRSIASYLLTNLHKILYHAMNIRIRALGISPMPVAELDGDVIEDAEQLHLNRSILEKCGFHEIQDLTMKGMTYGNYDDEEDTGTGFFVRVYPGPRG